MWTSLESLFGRWSTSGGKPVPDHGATAPAGAISKTSPQASTAFDHVIGGRRCDLCSPVCETAAVAKNTAPYQIRSVLSLRWDDIPACKRASHQALFPSPADRPPADWSSNGY